jgi:hypothetical protein
MPLNESARTIPHFTDHDAEVWAARLGREMELAQARVDAQVRKRLYGNGATAIYERPPEDAPKYVYQPFPKMVYGPNNETQIVQNREELDALSVEWTTRPKVLNAVQPEITVTDPETAVQTRRKLGRPAKQK